MKFKANLLMVTVLALCSSAMASAPTDGASAQGGTNANILEIDSYHWMPDFLCKQITNTDFKVVKEEDSLAKCGANTHAEEIHAAYKKLAGKSEKPAKEEQKQVSVKKTPKAHPVIEANIPNNPDAFYDEYDHVQPNQETGENCWAQVGAFDTKKEADDFVAKQRALHKNIYIFAKGSYITSKATVHIAANVKLKTACEAMDIANFYGIPQMQSVHCLPDDHKMTTPPCPGS